MGTMTMSAPTLADLQSQHAAQDAIYAAALDAGDAGGMIAARRRKADEEKSQALNRIEMDRMFSVNRIEQARRAAEGARYQLAQLAQLVTGATGA